MSDIEELKRERDSQASYVEYCRKALSRAEILLAALNAELERKEKAAA